MLSLLNKILCPVLFNVKYQKHFVAPDVFFSVGHDFNGSLSGQGRRPWVKLNDCALSVQYQVISQHVL